jgi:hypothetical protein
MKIEVLLMLHEVPGERSVVVLALNNAHSSFEVTEALLKTEEWERSNDEKHMFRNERGFWHPPLDHVELILNSGLRHIPFNTAKRRGYVM